MSIYLCSIHFDTTFVNDDSMRPKLLLFNLKILTLIMLTTALVCYFLFAQMYGATASSIAERNIGGRGLGPTMHEVYGL